MPRFDPHPDRRAAVVSGASSGIGRATAVALAAAGHPVVLGARRVDRCEETADEIRAAGGEALAVHLDLLDPGSVQAFATAADDAFGPIEIVVSNAGDVQPVNVVGDPDEFMRQVGVNLLGAQRLVHHLAPAMIARHRGDIVFVTSEVARDPRPHMAAYVASKAGLEGMARAMQMELEGTGVRVGMVRPGPSSTEQGLTWSAESIDEVLASWTRWGVLRHGGYLRPGDVAGAVLAVVAMPRGSQIALIEVQPEAPVIEPTDVDPSGTSEGDPS
jgi:NADP-dependent 3-hydroxy acid dehydrogenase YdfG